MEIAALVAEFVELSRLVKSGPASLEQQRRWRELRTLLLLAQRQSEPPTPVPALEGLEKGPR